MSEAAGSEDTVIWYKIVIQRIAGTASTHTHPQSCKKTIAMTVPKETKKHNAKIDNIPNIP